MKIVNVIGGLGNQMFQYAFAIALKQQHPDEEIKVDTQLYRFPFVKKYKGNNFYHNGYEIRRVFPSARFQIASFSDLVRESYFIPNYILYKAAKRVLPRRKKVLIQTYKDAYVYDSSVLTYDASYFEGYWMNPFYFDFCRAEVLKSFCFKEFDTEENQKWATLLTTDKSVTIHIRRGDYVGAENFKDICTLSYYRDAIAEARKQIENPVFFIFSNDQKWCKENLKDEFGKSDVHYVSNNKGHDSYRDMQLMSLARCNILANSSFSWWGAYLNRRDNQIVFCPEKWVNNLECKDFLLNKWIKISK